MENMENTTEKPELSIEILNALNEPTRVVNFGLVNLTALRSDVSPPKKIFKLQNVDMTDTKDFKEILDSLEIMTTIMNDALSKRREKDKRKGYRTFVVPVPIIIAKASDLVYRRQIIGFLYSSPWAVDENQLEYLSKLYAGFCNVTQYRPMFVLAQGDVIDSELFETLQKRIDKVIKADKSIIIKKEGEDFAEETIDQIESLIELWKIM